jgi:hypothetical protein
MKKWDEKANSADRMPQTISLLNSLDRIPEFETKWRVLWKLYLSLVHYELKDDFLPVEYLRIPSREVF